MLRPDRSSPFRQGPTWASGSAATAALIEPAAALAAFGLLWPATGIEPTPVDRLALLLMLALSFPAPDHLRQARAHRTVEVFLNAAMLAVVLLVCAWATGNLHSVQAGRWMIWALLWPAFQWLLLETAATLWALRLRRQRPMRAVVVGAGPLGQRVARALRRRGGPAVGSAMGAASNSQDSRDRPGPRVFVGWVAPGLAVRTQGSRAPRRLGELARLRDIVIDQKIDEVYLAMDHSDPAVLQALEDTAASVFLVPDVVDALVVQGRWMLIDGLPVVGLTQSPYSGVGAMIKRSMDIVLALLVLFLTWPMMLLIALWVRLDSAGPVLFRQRRLGMGGRPIEVWKFRTMHVMEDGDRVDQARRDDPRITRAGRVLRRTSLDEWPQFINVLQGRMSIVGPRPHALAHNEFYRRLVPAYMVRHLVRPGITGWAQIHGFRGETQTPEQMRRRIEYDLDYLRRWSPGLDLRIMLRTAGLLVQDAKAW